MSSNVERKASFGAIRGLLFMRIRELATRGSIIRSLGSFALVLGLLMLLSLDAEDGANRFRGLVSGLFLINFLPIYCLTKGGETLRSELKEGTIEYIWVRPASKAQLYIGFALSSLLDIAAVILPCLLAITLAGFGLRAFNGPGEIALLWTAGVGVVACFTAISGAMGAFTSKFVVLGIFYYSFVELGLGQIPNGIQKIAVTSHARRLMASFGDGDGLLTSGSIGGSLLWLCGACLLASAVGVAIFSYSHYVAGSEKEA